MFGEFSHGLQWFDETPACVGVHLAFKVFGDISRVGNDNASDILIDFSEDVPVIGIGGGEHEREQSSVVISRHRHFKTIIEAFSGMSPCGESTHGFVPCRILGKTDGDVSRIRILHKVRVSSSHAHEVKQDAERVESHAVYGDDECFVGTDIVEAKIIIDRFLGCPRTSLFIEREGERTFFFDF